MALIVVERIAFAIVSSVVIAMTGGGSNFLCRSVGATYLGLWIAYWIVQATRQRGEPSPYDRKQRAVYASGVAIIPALVAVPLWEYTHFTGPIPRDGPSAWFGIVLFGSGIAILAAAMKELGRFYTSYLGIQPGHYLVTTGPFRFVRHPGYLAEIMSMFGIALSLSSLVGMALAILSVPLVLVRIGPEEEMLMDAFGDNYRTYVKRTKRLVPFIY